MTSRYAAFLAFAVILILIPGPDFAVVTKNTLASGRTRGNWAAIGVSCSNFLQGTAAAAGLSALVVRAQPIFQVVKFAGAVYLAVLGVQALHSAVRGKRLPAEPAQQTVPAPAFSGWRQGFLTNITNPKVLLFYFTLLPQFLPASAGPGWLLVFAWSHALLSLAYLLFLTTALHGVRRAFSRRAVRRSLDAAAGVALVGFSIRLVTERG